MFSETKLRDIVNAKIKQDETLDEQADGSGHLGYISYKLNEIGKPEKVQTDRGQGWRIIYTYTIIVETEFTCYPDNPPHEFKYKKTIVVDDNGNIIKVSEKEAGIIE
ncbi:MAG: hypothetical protein IMY85_11300 [Chloroflexi bacterium]|nr:hypothetical protein [Chloroflexota bacterium]